MFSVATVKDNFSDIQILDFGFFGSRVIYQSFGLRFITTRGERLEANVCGEPTNRLL